MLEAPVVQRLQAEKADVMPNSHTKPLIVDGFDET